MGPTPDANGLSPGDALFYLPWGTELPTFRCPSDPGRGLPSFGRTNYAACMGDSPYRGSAGATDPALRRPSNEALWTRVAQRGPFVTRQKTRFRDILDGLSNTILVGEIATDLGDRDTRTNPRRTWSMTLESPAVCRDMYADPERPQFWEWSVGLLGTPSIKGFRGDRWADGNPVFTMMNTLLPPNSKTCVGPGFYGGNGDEHSAST
ncbi:unnamed protein product, partial [Hapterophycus canaliculatus]